MSEWLTPEELRDLAHGSNLPAFEVRDSLIEHEKWLAEQKLLMRKMDELGAMQILTARANGRMFGYHQTLIGPSLESADVLGALDSFARFISCSRMETLSL